MEMKGIVENFANMMAGSLGLEEPWYIVGAEFDDKVLCKLGIMQGVGDNKIDLKGTATRAQLAAMLQRFLQLNETDRG